MSDQSDQNYLTDSDMQDAHCIEMTASESLGDQGEVGQDQPPPVKKQRLCQYWHFRFTAYKVDQKDLQCLLDEIAEAYGFQTEKGSKTGQLHFQGTFDVGPSRQRWSQLEAKFQKISKEKLMFPKCDYLEKSGSSAADRYAMKEDTRVDGPWWKGVKFDEIAVKTVYRIELDLRPWQQAIKDRVLDAPPNDREIWSFWEPYGGLGKTTFQKWIFQEYKHVIVLGGKAADMKMGVINYLETSENVYPEIVIINIPKTFDMGYFSAAGTEEVKDMFFFSGKYKGGMAFGRPPKMLIFSNESLSGRDWSGDRLRSIRLPDGQKDMTSIPEEVWSA